MALQKYSYNTVESELRRLVMLYAQAMDRNEPDLLKDILTEDVVIFGPGFSISGLEKAYAIPQTLRDSYSGTRHLVHNQTVSIDEATAKAETYSTAMHLNKIAFDESDEDRSVLVWEIRYQDEFRLCEGQWCLSQRELIIDWTETRSISFLKKT